MSGLARIIVVLGLIVILAATVFPDAVASSQPDESVFDLGAVPLPIQELPEEGYQVLAGGYLDMETAASWIADPREVSMTSVADALSDGGWLQAYALDLVLLEDRAFAESDVLALVQTNVYLFSDVDGAGRVFDLMSDYSGRMEVEEMNPSVSDSMTVRLPGGSGDTIRSVAIRERTVVEVVTFEGFDFVRPDVHDAHVTGTVERLENIQQVNDLGLMPRAARLVDGDNLAELQNVEQSGVHQIYRIRDGVTQPAAGETSEPSPDVIAQGLVDLYHASEAMQLGNGTAFMSTWIGEFDSSASATAMLESMGEGNPSVFLVDPYFPIAVDEQATSQGIVGLYRVTGVHEGQPYSGSLEIRQEANFLVAIGFRAMGSALPPVDVTSRVMDYQLSCLEAATLCAPMDLAQLVTPPMATPIVPLSADEAIASEEFGWSLQVDTGEWMITEEFSEAGYDFVELRSGSSLVTLESVIDQHGEPQQCVIDELNMLQEFESSAVIDLGSDLDDEPQAGIESGHAWAIYTVEPLADERADQEYVIRFDCYTLIEGGASLVVSHRAPRDQWETERMRGDEIRNGLSFPASVRNDMPVALKADTWESAWRTAA